MQRFAIFKNWFRQVLATCAFFAFVSLAVMLFLGLSRDAWSQVIFIASLGAPIATWLFRMERGLSLRDIAPYVIYSIPAISLLVYASFSVHEPATSLPSAVVAVIVGVGLSLAGFLPNLVALYKDPQDKSAP